MTSRLLGVLFLTFALTPAAALRAAYADLSKGRPPAVLDPRIGLNVRLGDDPAPLPANLRGQSEPHLVRSPVNPQILLATFQEGRHSDGGAVACGYAVSRDGGLTWRRDLIPSLTAAVGGRFNRATDPVAGAGPQGDLYLQTLGSLRGSFDLAAVVVSRSTDNGATWSAPATVFEATATTPAPDKNWLAVNEYTGAPNPGRLVSTWTGFINNAAGATVSAHLLASVSDDRGVSWSAPITITPQGTRHQGTQPLFLPDGSLVVVYSTFLTTTDITTIDLRCKRSLDGGRTFPSQATTIVPVLAGWIDPQVRSGVFLPSAAVARDTGELFVSYVALANSSPRVFVTRSSDRGASWSAPVVVSDQPAGISVMNPTVAATPDGRSVSVFFMDKRDAPGGRDFVDYYVAHSYDGGITWQPNLRVSEMSSELRFGPPTGSGIMLGDYFALVPPAAANDPFVAIWCDTRSGDSDPFVATILATPTADYFSWARLRGVANFSHLDDPDRDGVSNYLEYLAGTHPLHAESGEDLVTRAVSPTLIEVTWAERAAGQRNFPSVGIAQTPVARLAAGGFSLSGISPAVDDADLPPAPEAGPGLIWRATRLEVPAGNAEALTRGYRWSAGLPTKISERFSTVNTDARLINLSTRGRSGAGANQMIVGFVINGNKTILVRAAGPALAALGVEGALAAPRLTLSAPASDLLRTNTNWEHGGVTGATFARLGAFPFQPGSLDAALLMPLGAQNYSAAVGDPAGPSGIALVEAYDADAAPGHAANPRLLNLSTRGEVGAGANALIAGFVLSGTHPRRVLIRALGPSLAPFGISGALPDPELTLFRGAAAIAYNDDWEISRSAAALAATARRVGAFALNRASLDAALLITLEPGAYTVVVSGPDGPTGIALVEIYDAD